MTAAIEPTGLQDVQLMAKIYPLTFIAPTVEDLAKIRPGGEVKLCCNSDSFWVLIDSVDGDTLIGVVDDGVVDLSMGVRDGDRVRFEKRHVYEIL
jgi:hypothetical protein